MQEPLKNFPEPYWLEIAEIMRKIETRLSAVPRWYRFRNPAPKDEQEKFDSAMAQASGVEKLSNIRLQTSLQHSFSLVFFATVFLERIKPYLEMFGHIVDEKLFYLCASLHDIGEGELKRDISWKIKNSSNDLDEYLAFKKLMGGLPNFSLLRRAFLLQFAHSELKGLPPEDAEDHSLLANGARRVDGLVFEAMEGWAYLIYQLEQCQSYGNSSALKVFIEDHVEAYDKMADRLPGFKEKFWTPEIRKWCVDFAREYTEETSDYSP